WRLVLKAAADSDGACLRPQIIPRSVTVMTSLDTYHLFMFRPTYRRLARLPLAERVREMRNPEIRQAILAESDERDPVTSLAAGLVGWFRLALPVTFPLSEPVNYEPSLDQSVFATGSAQGKDPQAHMYDLLLAGDGTAFYAVLGSNFVGGNLDVCKEMLLDA